MRAIEEPKAMVHRSTTFVTSTVPSKRSLAVPAVGISTFMMAAGAVGMPLIAIVVTVMLCITCVGIAPVWSADVVPPVIESPQQFDAYLRKTGPEFDAIIKKNNIN